MWMVRDFGRSRILLMILLVVHAGPSVWGQDSGKRGTEPAKLESWEITKRFGDGWLRKRFLLHEGLPQRITVPAVEVTVVDVSGKVAAGAQVVSHTPRHWVRLMPDMTLHPHPHGSATQTDAEGKFHLPQRTEPYRVLVLHASGVADVTHETLLYAKGRITLQPWSRIEGSVFLGGKPLVNSNVLLRPDYSDWSYSTGGPRVTGDMKVETDEAGRFAVDKAPPITGRAFLSSGPLSHATPFVCQPGKLTTLEMGKGKTVEGRISLSDLPPEQQIDWTDAVVWLRHHDARNPPPIELPREIADLDETARAEWRQDWELMTPEGRDYAAKRFLLVNQNYYGTVANDGSLRIDGVSAGTYDLAVRGFRIEGETQPRSVYVSTIPIQVTAPLGASLDLGTREMMDATTWRRSQMTPEKTDSKPAVPKVAIHRVVAHKNALPFGRGGSNAEPRRIRFGTMSAHDTRFDAMRPERYALDGLEYNPTPLISTPDIKTYDWSEHEIHLTDSALDRLRRNIKPSVWGVPFVVVVAGEPVYLGAFWTGASSYSASLPTICLDPWMWEAPEGDRHLPRNAVRIDPSQTPGEAPTSGDARDNPSLRKALRAVGKLVEENAVAAPRRSPNRLSRSF